MRFAFVSSFREVDPARLADKQVVVIDVLRATSVIVTGLARGAEAVLPAEEIPEAQGLAEQRGREHTLLAGERDGLPIEGFDLGNSPSLFTPERVRGRTVVLTTMNGTRALRVCAGAAEVLVACFLNAGAVARELAASGAKVLLVCSGMHGRFSLDDALCAGLIARQVAELCGAGVELDDQAGAMAVLHEAWQSRLPELLGRCCHGYRHLRSLGFHEDLEFCLRRDLFSVVPRYRQGSVRA